MKVGPYGSGSFTSSFCRSVCRGLLFPSSLRIQTGWEGAHRGRGRGRRGHRLRVARAGAHAAAADRRGSRQRAGHLWRGAVLPGAALGAAVRRELRRAADLRSAADDLCRPAGGRQQGRPAEPGRAGHGVHRRPAIAAQRQGARYQRHHRRPHRRHCRGRLYRRHDGGAGVRAARVADGGRLHRRLKAPARPPRPGHAAAHAVQRQASRCRLCPTTFPPSARWT